jgi:uncharacterized membrane protein (TIGR02234 family)
MTTAEHISRPSAWWRRKAVVVLAAIAVSLAAFGTTTQTWLNVRLPQGNVQTPDLAVPGSDAAVAVTALALVGLAAALAATIAGRIARIITAVLLGLAGAGVASACAMVLADPYAAASSKIGEATGQVGQDAAVTATAFPVLGLACGVLMAAVAIWLAVAGRHWMTSRKYSAATGPRQADGSPSDRVAADEIDSWDQLSRGTDPTD